MRAADSQLAFPWLQNWTMGDKGLGGGTILLQEAINFVCAALGPARLALSGPQPATESSLNCLID